MCKEHQSLEKLYLQQPSKSSSNTPRLRQENYSKEFNCNTARSSCWFVRGNGNGNDSQDDSKDESEDGNYVPNCNECRDAECHIRDANELEDRQADFNANSDAEGSNHDDDNDGDNGDQTNGGTTVKNAVDRHEEYDTCTGNSGCDNHHPHHHYARDRHIRIGSGGGEGNNDSSIDRADDKDDVTRREFIRDINFDNENKNDDADDDNDIATKSSSLPIDSIVPGKSVKDIKLATKETLFSLPINIGLDDKIKSQTTMITARNNNDNKKPPGARAKTLPTSNENTVNVSTTSHSSSLRPKTSSPRLPRGNRVELDYFYNSRIPSLDATGINKDFLARHTTDQSLQHYDSQSGDFSVPRKSTSCTDWPVWSLPPPHTTETNDLRHQWSQSNRLHPSVVDNQTTTQSNWNFWNQPSREMIYSKFPPQERKSFNHIDPLFAYGEEAFARLRLPESYPATNGTISGSSFNTHAAMASAYEPKEHYTANNIYGSHVNSSTYGGFPVRDEPPALRLPTAKPHAPMVCPSVTKPVTEMQPTTSMTSQSVTSYSYQSTVLPEKGQEPFMEPSIPNSFTENQEHVRPITSYTSRREDQRSGTEATSPEFPDDPSLAALERKVAEACAVVERVMKEREERTKAQREAARKRREMREQREREAREMREREERERKEKEEREREERKMRERQETEIREREETEMRERQERERREQIENEDRDTRWFGGERAPVQESPRWQCEHYQRRCLVKFPCCGIFYPCHRCHNTSGACDTDDRKANNATHVKCGICGHEEEVSGFVLTVIPKNCFAYSCCA